MKWVLSLFILFFFAGQPALAFSTGPLEVGIEAAHDHHGHSHHNHQAPFDEEDDCESEMEDDFISFSLNFVFPTLPQNTFCHVQNPYKAPYLDRHLRPPRA